MCIRDRLPVLSTLAPIGCLYGQVSFTCVDLGKGATKVNIHICIYCGNPIIFRRLRKRPTGRIIPIHIQGHCTRN